MAEFVTSNPVVDAVGALLEINRKLIALEAVAGAAKEVYDLVRSVDEEFGGTPWGATVRLGAALDVLESHDTMRFSVKGD